MKALESMARQVAGILALATALVAVPAWACEGPVAACDTHIAGGFPIVGAGEVVVVVDPSEAAPIRMAAQDLVEDIARVGGKARLARSIMQAGDSPAIWIGEAGVPGTLSDTLSGSGLGEAGFDGRWEAYRQLIVPSLTKGAPPVLVIEGSDPRGAVYGIYDLSERIGVSPWYWWGDVPPRRHTALWLAPGAREDAPDVRYRGIFINDEDPAFGGWAREKFGGVNGKAYAHVFELILRLKGNYLWPAMWGKSIAEDDPQSLALAAQRGIVLGTSHHEPLTRAHAEWDRAKREGKASGDWNYATNAEQLQRFWRAGMERFVASGADGVVTVGMRGDGDEAMSETTAIPLLEKIVSDQRQIIADTTGKPASETPQVWALYKEVQDYYDQGMQVPDDVTLLFSDDNWGQIRRLPDPDAAPRAGGYGVYYHYDYVGGPRSYKWIDTIQTGKVWQQMDLAWQRGARALWIVNVGDLKPDEYPIDFFLDMAWNADDFGPDKLAGHAQEWAAQQFGAAQSGAIARVMEDYAMLVARKKPELLDAKSFPVSEYAALAKRWDSLGTRAQAIGKQLTANQQDAWFELVEHRVLAVGNLYRMYAAAAQNAQAAASGDPVANRYADAVEQAFAYNAELTKRYHALAGGKWNHMMDQTHIGYTSWQDPPENVMPEVVRIAEGATRNAVLHIPAPEPFSSFVPATAIAESVTRSGLSWTQVASLGSTWQAMVALPQGRPATEAGEGPSVSYSVRAPAAGVYRLELNLSPTLDTIGDRGMRIGVQVDGGPIRTLTERLDPTNGTTDTPAQSAWVKGVTDNRVTLPLDLGRLEKGDHTISIYRIDDNVVLDSLRFSADGGSRTDTGS